MNSKSEPLISVDKTEVDETQILVDAIRAYQLKIIQEKEKGRINHDLLDSLLDVISTLLKDLKVVLMAIGEEVRQNAVYQYNESNKEGTTV